MKRNAGCRRCGTARPDLSLSSRPDARPACFSRSWAPVPGPLQLEEPVGRRAQQHAVPQQPGRLTFGRRRDDGAEDGHCVVVDHRRAHVVTDGIHAGVVGGRQRLVELLGGGRLGQRGRQADLVECLGNDGPLTPRRGPASAGGCGCRAPCRAGRGCRALQLLGRHADAHGALGQRQAGLVLVGELVSALVEDGQRHHVPADVDVAHLLDLQHPAGGDPGPRAEGIEPEVGRVGGRVRCRLVAVSVMGSLRRRAGWRRMCRTRRRWRSRGRRRRSRRARRRAPARDGAGRARAPPGPRSPRRCR